MWGHPNASDSETIPLRGAVSRAASCWGGPPRGRTEGLEAVLHCLRQGAPDSVRSRLLEIPEANQLVLMDTPEADALADAYLSHGIIGPGSRSDALHVALATIGRVDVLVSWNFRHIVNLGKIRLFNAVNLEQGYGLIEIRTSREVLADEDVL